MPVGSSVSTGSSHSSSASLQAGVGQKLRTLATNPAVLAFGALLLVCGFLVAALLAYILLAKTLFSSSSEPAVTTDNMNDNVRTTTTDERHTVSSEPPTDGDHSATTASALPTASSATGASVSPAEPTTILASSDTNDNMYDNMTAATSNENDTTGSWTPETNSDESTTTISNSSTGASVSLEPTTILASNDTTESMYDNMTTATANETTFAATTYNESHEQNTLGESTGPVYVTDMLFTLDITTSETPYESNVSELDTIPALNAIPVNYFAPGVQQRIARIKPETANVEVESAKALHLSV